jgi:hypothetical protein
MAQRPLPSVTSLAIRFQRIHVCESAADMVIIIQEVVVTSVKGSNEM